MAEEKDDTLEEGGEGVVAPEKEPEQPQAQEPAEEQPDPYAPLAQKLGWVPKDQFKGNETDWKPAEQFILDGKEIQKGLSKELKELRGTVSTMSRTSAAILKDQLDAQRERLSVEYRQAVEEGDPDKAFKIGEKLHNVGQSVQQGPPPESVEWVNRNPWFNSDPLAKRLAQQTAQAYAEEGRSVSEQLDAAEREVKRQYPHLFPREQNARAAPAVSAPTSRAASQSNRAKTFGDMPKAAQDVAKDMVDRGVIPNADVYVRNYFASEGKAR